MKRRPFYFAFIGFAGLLLAGPPHAAAAPRSNIVYFLVDDLGYADVGFNGCKDVRTPNIDRLAKEGAVLGSFYVQPVCSPTCAALMTGRYATHTGVYTFVRPGAPWGLPLAERTLPQALREASYTTLVKLAGASPDQTLSLDALDVWPALTRGAKTPHDAILLAGTTPGKMAIRMRDWKLLMNATEKDAEEAAGVEPKSTGRVELYNVADDVSESKDLAATQPEKVKQLRTRLDAFLKNAAPPGDGAAPKRAAAKARRVQPTTAGADK